MGLYLHHNSRFFRNDIYEQSQNLWANLRRGSEFIRSSGYKFVLFVALDQDIPDIKQLSVATCQVEAY